MSKLSIETIVVGPIATNCYIVWPQGSTSCWIIDPGGLGGKIIKAVEKHALTPEMIIITHGHWDHFIGNRAVKKHWPKTPIAAHPDDAPALPDPNVNLSMSFLGQLVKSPPADQFLTHGQMLHLGDCEFEVIHTPGHSPGGVCLYCKTEKTAFVGDLIFAGGGVGRTDLPRASTEQLYQSIDLFFSKVDPDTTIYPGHGPTTSALSEKNLFR